MTQNEKSQFIIDKAMYQYLMNYKDLHVKQIKGYKATLKMNGGKEDKIEYPYRRQRARSLEKEGNIISLTPSIKSNDDNSSNNDDFSINFKLVKTRDATREENEKYKTGGFDEDYESPDSETDPRYMRRLQKDMKPSKRHEEIMQKI